MLWIHPALEALGLVLALWALWLGWRRLAMAHLGRNDLSFPWRRHVVLGNWAMGLWLGGLGLGLGMAWWTWKMVSITGAHYQVGLAMVPLMVFGLVSGQVMDRRKAKRRVLPLAHGVNNLVLVALALAQLATGIRVITVMVLP